MKQVPLKKFPLTKSRAGRGDLLMIVLKLETLIQVHHFYSDCVYTLLKFADTPSNIAYDTPTRDIDMTHDVAAHPLSALDPPCSVGGSPASTTIGTVSSVGSGSQYEEKLQQFNKLFQHIWIQNGTSKGQCFTFYRAARRQAPTTKTTGLRTWKNLDVAVYLYRIDEARGLVFEEAYELANSYFEECHEGFGHLLGQDNWLTLLAKFEASLMRVASSASCSSNLAFRFLQECLLFLNSIRTQYAETKTQSALDLSKILKVSRRLTIFWTQIVTSQIALKYLKSTLGSDHQQVSKLQKELEKKESAWKSSTYSHFVTTKSYENDFEDIHQRTVNAVSKTDPWRRTVALAAHCDHMSTEEHSEFLANSKTSDLQLTQGAKLRTKHRCDNLQGAIQSFFGNHKSAETLLSNTQNNSEVEICAENKIHQLLIWAEHKSRESNWDLSYDALQTALKMLAEGNEFSLKVLKMFKPRTDVITKAFEFKLTVDDAAGFASRALRESLSPPASLVSSATTSASDASLSEVDWSNSLSPRVTIRTSSSPGPMGDDDSMSIGSEDGYGFKKTGIREVNLTVSSGPSVIENINPTACPTQPATTSASEQATGGALTGTMGSPDFMEWLANFSLDGPTASNGTDQMLWTNLGDAILPRSNPQVADMTAPGVTIRNPGFEGGANEQSNNDTEGP
jgi:hypothetical protein